MEEESFPRGGVATRQESSTGKKPRTSKEKTLFRESETSDAKKKVKKRKDRRDKKTGRYEKRTKKIEGTVSGQASHWQPEVLSKNIYTGMLVYGYVNEIETYSIKMALPNGIMGTVPITDVSPTYTERIQQFAAKSKTEQEQEGESMTTLSDLFTVGDLLPCKVTDCDTGNKNIKLSLNPADVNESLIPGSIKNGMFVYGSIGSEEDHGYTLDLGVKGINAFLPNTEAEQYIQSRNSGNPLRVGQCLMCGVKKGAKKGSDQSRVITVSIDPEHLKSLQLYGSADVPFSSLIPGMKVKATVDKVLDNGLTVNFQNLTGSIHVSHLLRATSNYSPEEELNATVLYIHPMSKAVVLSCLPYIVNYAGVPGNQFPDISRGRIFPDAKVKKISKKGKKGVYLKLVDKVTGFASVFNLSDNVDQDSWEKGFHKGTTHRCRAIGFYPMEGLVNVTLKKSELEKKYMTVDDITPGSLVECHVRKFSKNGLSVTISKGIVGFIPNVHLADVTLRHPEKQFSEGNKLKCRVLSISSDKKMVFLTHKKSLVTTKYPIVTSYNQLKPDMVIEGYISDIKAFGVFVKFFEDIEGCVPKALLSSEPIKFLEKVFYYGQVVRCKVVKVDPSEGKLRLTFMIEGKPKGFGHKEADAPDDYAVGNFSRCRVIGKQEKGLDVLLLPSKKKAFLPKQHLSDSLEMCNALLKFYKEKDIIEEVMYFNKSHIVLVTLKPSLISAAHEGELVTDVNNLQLGVMIPGWVRNTVPYGVFLEFPGKLCGLVPRRYSMDKVIADQSDMFKYGQTVVAKVIEVDKEKKRFLASLRMLDCYHGDTEMGIDILANYLEEQHKLQNLLTDPELKCMVVGQIYPGTVAKINDLGAVCDLDNGVKAIALKDHLEGIEDISESSEFDCVVLHIDVVNNCVEVTLNPQLVMAVRKRSDRNKSDSTNQAHVSQEIKCKVVLVKDDFILVSLKGHAAGQLAYLPSKRHHNDFIEKHQYGIGQENPAVVKRIDQYGNILASLKVHEDKMKKEEETVISHIPTHSLKIGDIRTAVVKRIHPDQLHIAIDGTHGRVHATEVHDELTDGTLPFKDIAVKSEVQVRVIGFRETKSWKALPISHPNLKRSCPECSMRPSVLAMDNFPSNYDFAANNLRVGDKVVAYPYNFTGEIMWTHVRPFVQGKVSVLNLTDTDHFFKKPGDKFIPGRGYTATVIGVEDNKLVDSYNSTVELSFLEDVATVSEGEVTRGVITAVRPEMGIVLKLANNVRGAAGLTDLSDGYVDYPTTGFEVGHLVRCFILTYNEEEKRADVSLRKSRIEGFEGMENPDIRSIEELSEGQIIRGYVVKHTEHGLQVRLGHFISGLVHKSCITDKGKVKSTETLFKVGKLVTCKILSINVAEKQVKLSMLEKDTGVTLDTDIPQSLITHRERKDSDSESSKKSKRKRSISGSSTEHGEPTVPKHPKPAARKVSTDSKSGKKILKEQEGKTDIKTETIAKKVNKVKKENDRETSDESETEKKHKIVRKRKSDKSSDEKLEMKEEKVSDDTFGGTPKKKKKQKDSGDEIKEKFMETAQGESSDEEDVKIPDPSSMPHLDLSEGFSWSSDFQLPVPSGHQREISSDESEDEEVKKPVKKTKEEMRREKQEEEKRLYEYERRQLEGEISPETADDFDRLVLQSPDSSLIWLRYMAFHLETSEIDKARAVAERALKTISFREEQEKLNVWVAYLNLENMYGSKESLQKVLARAVQQNDATSVYLQMINIYCKSEKTEEAEHLYNILIKKDSLNKDIWVKFGQFYFQNSRLQSARKLLQRCLKTVENKHHVETIAKFAQMEFKFGEPERGKTMYENILSTYPKRTDLWSVYVDMVTKHKEFDAARALYQRVTSLKLSARKMKFFFKKYLEFEELHGTETLVAEVKKKALDFVEKQGYVDD